MADEVNLPDIPAPTFRCPLHVTGCEWGLDTTDMTNAQINTACQAHTEDHSKEDYLDGLGAMATTIGQLRLRIEELESALRGAVLASGGAPMGVQPPKLDVVTDRHHGDVVNIAGQDRKLVGKRLPDHIAKELGIRPRRRKRDPNG